jgi:hypothetical protein
MHFIQFIQFTVLHCIHWTLKTFDPAEIRTYDLLFSISQSYLQSQITATNAVENWPQGGTQVFKYVQSSYFYILGLKFTTGFKARLFTRSCFTALAFWRQECVYLISSGEKIDWMKRGNNAVKEERHLADTRQKKRSGRKWTFNLRKIKMKCCEFRPRQKNRTRVTSFSPLGRFFTEGIFKIRYIKT